MPKSSQTALSVSPENTYVLGELIHNREVTDSIAAAIQSLTAGMTISHSNPFTTVCLGLLILLWVISELTIRNMRQVLEHRVEDLRAQLLAYDIQPRF